MMLVIVLVVAGYTALVLYLRHANRKKKYIDKDISGEKYIEKDIERGEDDG